MLTKLSAFNKFIFRRTLPASDSGFDEVDRMGSFLRETRPVKGGKNNEQATHRLIVLTGTHGSSNSEDGNRAVAIREVTENIYKKEEVKENKQRKLTKLKRKPEARMDMGGGRRWEMSIPRLIEPPGKSISILNFMNLQLQDIGSKLPILIQAKNVYLMFSPAKTVKATQPGRLSKVSKKRSSSMMYVPTTVNYRLPLRVYQSEVAPGGGFSLTLVNHKEIGKHCVLQVDYSKMPPGSLEDCVKFLAGTSRCLPSDMIQGVIRCGPPAKKKRMIEVNMRPAQILGYSFMELEGNETKSLSATDLDEEYEDDTTRRKSNIPLAKERSEPTVQTVKKNIKAVDDGFMKKVKTLADKVTMQELDSILTSLKFSDPLLDKKLKVIRALKIRLYNKNHV